MLRTAYTRHDPDVLNQFLYGGKSEGSSACMTISIQVLFQLSDAMTRDGTVLKLGNGDWQKMMWRGIRLWQLWRKSQAMKQEQEEILSSFPSILEVLGLPECESFYRLFKKEIEEYGGLVCQSRLVENPEASLLRFMNSIVSQITTHGKKQACALITLPHNCTVALFCYPLQQQQDAAYTLFFFDSHGIKGSKNIELLQFMDYREATRYMIIKYRLESIDSYIIDHPTTNNNSSEGRDEMALYNQYTYSATLFTSK